MATSQHNSDFQSKGLKEGKEALEVVSSAKFEDKDEQFSHFEVLYKTFKHMKGLNNERLPEYVTLMRDLLTFI